MGKERLLITVKTYPTLSRKHGETVCTAAVRPDGSWMRLFPIPFRLMDYKDRYSKFDWIETTLISQADREKLKQASKGLLASLKEHLASMPNWTKNTTTQADVEMFILDNLYASLPRPPFTDEEADALATRLYGFVWQRSNSGEMSTAAA